MADGITWAGMRELLSDFETLAQLDQPVGEIVETAAERTLSSAQIGYAAASLRRGLRLRRKSPLSVNVQQTQPHGHLYELGTVLRARRTGASTGRMPSRPVLIRAAIQWRARMLEELAALLGDARRLGVRMLETRGG